MKKVLFTLLIFSFYLKSYSQCNPDPSIQQVGFFPADTLLDCVERGLYYNEVILFKNFDIISGSLIGLPGDVTIISVAIDSIRNLPDGITTICNTPGCFYNTGENGCVRVQGTTNAAPGVYYLGIYATLIVDFGLGPIQIQADSQFLSDYGLGYSLTVINAGDPCVNTDAPFLLYVNARSERSFCVGDTVPLYTSVSGGMPPYSYSWSPAVNLTNSNAPDPMLLPTNPGWYRVTVTDNFNFSVIDSVEISYIATPFLIVTPDTAICPGGTIQLVAEGGQSYSWTPSTGLSATDIPNPMVSLTSSETYTVEATLENCVNTETVHIEIDTLDPVANFNDPIINVLSVLFTNSSSHADNFLWDFGDGNSSTQSNPSHQYTQFGVYDITLIASNVCGLSDTITKTLNLTVGIEDLMSGKMKVEVYPNPGTGIYQIALAEALSKTDLNYAVFSIQGDLITSGLIEGNDSAFQLDISQEAKGIYFLKMTGKDFSVIKKIVSQ